MQDSTIRRPALSRFLDPKHVCYCHYGSVQPATVLTLSFQQALFWSNTPSCHDQQHLQHCPRNGMPAAVIFSFGCADTASCWLRHVKSLSSTGRSSLWLKSEHSWLGNTSACSPPSPLTGDSILALSAPLNAQPSCYCLSLLHARY